MFAIQLRLSEQNRSRAENLNRSLEFPVFFLQLSQAFPFIGGQTGSLTVVSFCLTNRTLKRSPSTNNLFRNGDDSRPLGFIIALLFHNSPGCPLPQLRWIPLALISDDTIRSNFDVSGKHEAAYCTSMRRQRRESTANVPMSERTNGWVPLILQYTEADEETLRVVSSRKPVTTPAGF